nr:MAG TPA: hypothetical protein [Caudoviricetes sp.]
MSFAVSSIEINLAEWGYSIPQLGQTILSVHKFSDTVYSQWQVQNILNFRNIAYLSILSYLFCTNKSVF